MAQSSNTSNVFLGSLDRTDFGLLEPHLRTVQLPQESVLFEAGDKINSVYFLHSGIVSILVALSTGESVEAGMIGIDGVAGAASALGATHSVNRGVVQVEGAASAMDADKFGSAVERSPLMRARLSRYEQFLYAQAQQGAAC